MGAGGEREPFRQGAWLLMIAANVSNAHLQQHPDVCSSAGQPANFVLHSRDIAPADGEPHQSFMPRGRHVTDEGGAATDEGEGLRMREKPCYLMSVLLAIAILLRRVNRDFLGQVHRRRRCPQRRAGIHVPALRRAGQCPAGKDERRSNGNLRQDCLLGR